MAHETVKDELRRAYDAKADERDSMKDAQWKQPQRDRFLARLREADARTLLELGAGHGVNAQYFAGQGLAVTCVDMSPRLVERCRARGLDARVMDFTDLDLPDAAFDAVFAMNSVLHVPRTELTGTLAGVARVLRSEGLFYWGQYGGNDHEGPLDTDHYEPKRYFSLLTDARIREYAEQHFEVLDFDRIDFPETGYAYHALVLRPRR